MTALIPPDTMTPFEIRDNETDAFAAACYEALTAYVAAADNRLVAALAALKATPVRPVTAAALVAEARQFLRQPLELVGS